MKRPQRAIDLSEHAAGPSILLGASGQRHQRSLVCERTAFKLPIHSCGWFVVDLGSGGLADVEAAHCKVRAG